MLTFSTISSLKKYFEHNQFYFEHGHLLIIAACYVVRPMPDPYFVLLPMNFVQFCACSCISMSYKKNTFVGISISVYSLRFYLFVVKTKRFSCFCEETSVGNDK